MQSRLSRRGRAMHNCVHLVGRYVYLCHITRVQQRVRRDRNEVHLGPLANCRGPVSHQNLRSMDRVVRHAAFSWNMRRRMIAGSFAKSNGMVGSMFACGSEGLSDTHT